MSHMEWIETTGKTVAEARELAVDQLRVDESEVEFEVVQEPKQGLFGRSRGIARVRARVARTAPRAKNDRRRGKPKDQSGSGASAKANKGGQRARSEAASPSSDKAGSGAGRSTKSGPKNGKGSQSSGEGNNRGNGDRARAGKSEAGSKAAGVKTGAVDGKEGRASTGSRGDSGSSKRTQREPMDPAEQIKAVESFLSGILEAFGVSGELSSTLEGRDLYTNVQGGGLGGLVGPRLATLEALQELARLSLQREAGGKEYARVTVDVAGVRELRKESLEGYIRSQADRVRDEGATIVFEEMSSVDRKQVHDMAAELDGVGSRSEGEDPHRRVALVPAD